MPELPEVEVLVRHLAPLVRGRRVTELQIARKRVVRPQPSPDLERELSGATFMDVRRRGKYLLFDYHVPRDEGVRTLLAHLGMTGRIFLQAAKAPLPRHVVAFIGLGKDRWIFEDPRGFGRLSLDLSPLELLGPEPLAGSFTPDLLRRSLRRSRQAVKLRLLDQATVAGLGNIYACEALHRAGISPRRVARRLTRVEVERLHDAIRGVLVDAISLGSTLPLQFAASGSGDRLFYFGQSSGAARDASERFAVYDRAGQPCPQCATPIRRLIQGGRSTFHCPRCQR
jgi:formamidopyrimidine-DNA glycosylase